MPTDAHGSWDVAQEVSLPAGWSAIWLEVNPSGEETISPGDLFTDPAITQVAALDGAVGTGQFTENLEGAGLNDEAWRIWRRNPVVSENTLTRIEGNRAYLVHNDGDSPVTLTITGEVRFFQPDWIPDAYNLVGFGLDPDNPPTFEQFFGPSGDTHSVDRIFRLLPEGDWAPVRSGELMQAGSAYWVYANGPSSYMGPLSIAFSQNTPGLLDFGPGVRFLSIEDPENSVNRIPVNLRTLTIANRTSALISPILEKHTPTGTVLDDDLRLFRLRPERESLDYAFLGGIGSAFPLVAEDEAPLAPAETRSLSLAAHRHWEDGGQVRQNLYRLQSGLGTHLWIPVRASNPSISLAGDSSLTRAPYVGLWVGEVVADRVTSIVETGAPEKAAAAPAAMRLLLHADAAGQLHLLSQVTLLQEATASPDDRPAMVAVVDPRQIPFYEGIAEQEGKRIGTRLETIAYDLPRKTDTITQAALLEAIVSQSTRFDSTWVDGRDGDGNPLYTDPADIDEAAIASFLAFRSSRPPDLVEAYHLTWPLEGGIGPGKLIRTPDEAPLYLDPFHRSNPFRHAFHTQHGSGADIRRSLNIRLDPQSGASGLLTGDYREEIHGLIRDNLIIQGRVRLHKVSDAPTLQ